MCPHKASGHGIGCQGNQDINPLKAHAAKAKLTWQRVCCKQSQSDVVSGSCQANIYALCVWSRKILRINMCTMLNEHVLYKRNGPGRIWRSQKKI